MANKNAEKCKRYRQKNLDKIKRQDAARKKKERENIKNNPAKYKKYLDDEKRRKKIAALRKNDPTIEKKEPVSPEHHSSFTTKQSRHRSINRVENALPKCPTKSCEIIKRLATKYQLRVKLGTQIKKKILSNDEKGFLLEWLDKPDITYTNPGRKDNIYVGKLDGVSQYKTKKYLLWTLNETLSLINEDEINGFEKQFGVKLSFSKFYDFIKQHKEYRYVYFYIVILLYYM